MTDISVRIALPNGDSRVDNLPFDGEEWSAQIDTGMNGAHRVTHLLVDGIALGPSSNWGERYLLGDDKLQVTVVSDDAGYRIEVVPASEP